MIAEEGALQEAGTQCEWYSSFSTRSIVLFIKENEMKWVERWWTDEHDGTYYVSGRYSN
jgi:hypothetical protein